MNAERKLNGKDSGLPPPYFIDTLNLTKLSVRYTLYGFPTTSTIIYSTNAGGTIVLSSVGAVGQPIMKKRAREMGGVLTVSSPNNGTQVNLQIPLPISYYDLKTHY